MKSRAPLWFVAGAVTASVLVGGVAVAASSSAKIHACESKSTGALRIAKHCTKHEKTVAWNSRGPAGKAGKPGKNGTLDGFASGPATTNTLLPSAGTKETVASVTIPASAAGHYIVTASVTIYSTSASNPFGSCDVTGGSSTTNSVPWETSGTTNLLTVFPTMTAEVEVPAAGATLSYECSSNANVTAEGASLSAMQVSNAPAV